MNYKDEGNKFHRRIERLMKRAGAEIIKSNPNDRGPDIILKLDNNKVIAQCKYSPKGKNIQQIHNLIYSYSRQVQKLRAKAAILAFGGYQIPQSILDKRHKILERDKVAIWTDKTISSYESLAKSIGRYTKYQLIGDLGIRLRSRIFNVDALPVNQSGFTFYITKLNPSYLMKACFVARRVDDPRKYQRYLTRTRIVNQIPSYLMKEIGIFPNSIILVSNYPLDYKRGKLSLRDAPSSFWILDGQHRVYAFNHVSDSDLSNNYDIICSIFDGTTKMQDHNFQAQLFVKINNEAKKVSPSLITDLAESFQGIPFHERQINIMKSLRTSKIFKGKFKSYRGTGGVLNPTTFCTNQSMIRLTREVTGLIFKNIKRKSNKIEEERAVKFLRNYFKLVASVFRKEWQAPKKYILCSDRGIRGLLHFYEKILKYTNYRDDQGRIKEVLSVLKKSKPELRISEMKGLYFGEGGARELADYFARKVNDTIPTFDPSVEKEIFGKEVRILHVYGKKDKLKAKDFVSDVFKNYFDGSVYGELMHIDKTTFDYLELLPESCKRIRLCVQDVKNKKACSARLKKLRESGFDIILTKKKLHERWMGTNKYIINFNTDLKDDAIASKKHTKRLMEINRNNEVLKKFKEDWDYYERMNEDYPIYDYDPSANEESMDS